MPTPDATGQAIRRFRAVLYETVKLEMRAKGELEPTEVVHLVRS